MGSKKTLTPQKQLRLDLQDADVTNVNVGALIDDGTYPALVGSPPVIADAEISESSVTQHTTAIASGTNIGDLSNVVVSGSPPAELAGARLVYNGTAWVPDTTVLDAYDIPIHAFGAITAPQQIALIAAVRDFRIEATGHTGYANVPPASAGSPLGSPLGAELDVQKNGVSIGTIVVGGSPNGFQFDITETDFTVGDRLEVIVLNDDGMEDFGFTLKGKVI